MRLGLPRSLNVALLSLAWLAVPVADALHQAAEAHAVCAEHRVVEHVEHGDHGPEGADEDHDDGGREGADEDHDDDGHEGEHDADLCQLLAGTAGQGFPGAPAPVAQAAAVLPAERLAAAPARGPPVLSYAAKTSPPTA